MTFGIYAGSVAGTETGLAKGKDDDSHKILKALYQLSNSVQIFLVRGYIHYLGEGKLGEEAPGNVEQYANATRKLVIVICYRAIVFDKNDWTKVIIKIINRYKNDLYAIQITEEPNLKTAFAGDGSFDDIEQALLTGIIAAKQEIEKQQLKIKVGFNTVPSFNAADRFWEIIGSTQFKEMRDCVDYIGLDFYPDVFRPVALDGQPNDLEQSVKNVLKHFRNVSLKTGNIPLSVPVHITENGWATGHEKPYEKQARVIEKIITTIMNIKDELNIDIYELFALRDTDTSNQNLFYQFGLLNDNYLPKPAFKMYQRLIENYTFL